MSRSIRRPMHGWPAIPRPRISTPCEQMHERGFRVSLAGGIGPDTLDAVIARRARDRRRRQRHHGIRKPQRDSTMDSRQIARSRPWLAVGREIAELLDRIDADAFARLVGAFDDPDQRWFFSGPGPLRPGRADGSDALHAYWPHRAFRRRGVGAVDPQGRRAADHLRLGRNAGQRRLRPHRQGGGRQGGDADAQAARERWRASPTSRCTCRSKTRSSSAAACSSNPA